MCPVWERQGNRDERRCPRRVLPRKRQHGERGDPGVEGRLKMLAPPRLQMGARSYVPALGRFLTPDRARGVGERL